MTHLRIPHQMYQQTGFIHYNIQYNTNNTGKGDKVMECFSNIYVLT